MITQYKNILKPYPCKHKIFIIKHLMNSHEKPFTTLKHTYSIQYQAHLYTAVVSSPTIHDFSHTYHLTV